MTTDTITVLYNYNFKWKESCRKVNTKHIYIKDGSFKSFENGTVKLSAKETKWS